MIYEYAAEPYNMWTWAWIPALVAAVIIAVTALIMARILRRDHYAAGEDATGTAVVGAFLVAATFLLGMLVPSMHLQEHWEARQIADALTDNGYTQVREGYDWVANLDGEFRTGTASIRDNIVTIKDLTDLEVVE